MSANAYTRVLRLLKERGDAGALTAELMEVGGERFGSRVDELRKQGHVIVAVYVRQGSYRYSLVPAVATLPAKPDRLPSVEDRLAAAWVQRRCGDGLEWFLDLTDRRVLAAIEDALFPEDELMAA